MRISDWSSDVCSSDLEISGRPSGCPAPYGLPHGGESVWCRTKQPLKQNKQPQNRGTSDCTKKREQQSRHKPETQKVTQRSEERRAGTECVSTCRSRRSP